MIIQTYYISTGKLNAMYTLRCERMDSKMNLGAFTPDFYICNLSTDIDKAEAKAQEYVDAFRDRVGESEEYKIVFDPSAPDYLNKRRGKLSIVQTNRIEMIESGFFPFGKFAGTKITDAPDSYVLFFADKSREEQADPVFGALCAACLGVALEKGLIAKRETARAEIAEKNARSMHIHNVGDKVDLTLCINVVFQTESKFGINNMHICNVDGTDNVVIYSGSAELGKKGETVRVKATIKRHDEYKGVKQTVIQRPIAKCN